MLPNNILRLVALNTTRRNELLGQFKYKPASEQSFNGEIIILDDWRTKNLVPVIIPQLKGIEGAGLSCRFLMHKRAAASLQAIFKEIEERNLLDRIKEWGGCYCPRLIRGSTSALSSHSWGAAVDINQSYNGLGKEPLPAGVEGSVAELVPIFAKHGWFWGGWFTHRLDGMHFEWCGDDPEGGGA